MTDKEALKEILNSTADGKKWYHVSADLFESERLRATALRILNGTAKPDTKKRFFESFGYEYQLTENIVKKHGL